MGKVGGSVLCAEVRIAIGSVCSFGSFFVNGLVGLVMVCVISLAELGVSSFSGVCVGTLTELEHDGWHT